MKRAIIKALKVIVALVILVFVISELFGAPKPVQLYEDYYFVRYNGENSIIKGVFPVVSSYIDDYEVIGCYTFGVRKGIKKPNYKDGRVNKSFEYFVLNMSHGELQDEIPEEEFKRIKDLVSNRDKRLFCRRKYDEMLNEIKGR